MHGNKFDVHINPQTQYKLPLVYAGLFVVSLGLLSYQTNVVAMWWRTSVSGVAFTVSSTLFSSLFATVAHVPGVHSVYVDPAVLEACPGYVANKVAVARGGSELRVDLGLPKNAKGCGVFGPDVEKLSLVVTYETGE
jgi:hypothetical protein